MKPNVFRNFSLAKSLAASWVLGVTLAATLLLRGEPKSLKSGDAFPDLQQFKLEGSFPQDLKGKVVLVDFWASWCGPCKESFPVLDELYKTYGKSGFVVIGINLDDKPKAMDEFLKRRPVTFPMVRDSAKTLVAAVDIQTMPTSFLVDRSGKVHSVHSGFRGAETKRAYVQEIEALLK